MGRKGDTFELNIKFNHNSSKTQADTKTDIKSWISTAEKLYNDSPKLKIIPTYNWKVSGVEKDKEFKNSKEASKFMDDNFDNYVGKSKTDGYMQVLILDTAIKKGFDMGGRAFFPHSVNPFSRKFGILMTTQVSKYTLSHEIGHVFSLKHTFENYVTATKGNCNRGYPKGEKGKGGTRKNGRINLMDYCRESGDIVFLNSCQKERAAKQRQKYLTRDGKVNYKKLTGHR